MKIEKRKNYWVVLDTNQVWLVTKYKDVAKNFYEQNQKK